MSTVGRKHCGEAGESTLRERTSGPEPERLREPRGIGMEIGAPGAASCGSRRSSNIHHEYIDLRAPGLGAPADQHFLQGFGGRWPVESFRVPRHLLSGHIPEPQDDVHAATLRVPLVRLVGIELIGGGVPHLAVPLALDLDRKPDRVADRDEVGPPACGHPHLRHEPDGIGHLTGKVVHPTVSTVILPLWALLRPVRLPHVGAARVHPLLECVEVVGKIGPHVVDVFEQLVRHDRVKVGNVRSGVLEVAASLALQREGVPRDMGIRQGGAIDQVPQRLGGLACGTARRFVDCPLDEHRRIPRVAAEDPPSGHRGSDPRSRPSHIRP